MVLMLSFFLLSSSLFSADGMNLAGEILRSNGAIVRVWNSTRLDEVGHASLQAGNFYVSFWPKEQPKITQPSVIGELWNIDQDFHTKGKPSEVFLIMGMNVSRIAAVFDQIKTRVAKKSLKWNWMAKIRKDSLRDNDSELSSLTDLHCSSMVFYLLMKGGICQYLSNNGNSLPPFIFPHGMSELLQEASFLTFLSTSSSVAFLRSIQGQSKKFFGLDQSCGQFFIEENKSNVCLDKRIKKVVDSRQDWQPISSKKDIVVSLPNIDNREKLNLLHKMFIYELEARRFIIPLSSAWLVVYRLSPVTMIGTTITSFFFFDEVRKNFMLLPCSSVIRYFLRKQFGLGPKTSAVSSFIASFALRSLISSKEEVKNNV